MIKSIQRPRCVNRARVTPEIISCLDGFSRLSQRTEEGDEVLKRSAAVIPSSVWISLRRVCMDESMSRGEVVSEADGCGNHEAGVARRGGAHQLREPRDRARGSRRWTGRRCEERALREAPCIGQCTV